MTHPLTHNDYLTMLLYKKWFQLLRWCEVYINISYCTRSTTIIDYNQLNGDKIDMIIDGGQCPGGRESTVVDVTGEVPVVLREGAISKEELRQVCEII